MKAPKVTKAMKANQDPKSEFVVCTKCEETREVMGYVSPFICQGCEAKAFAALSPAKKAWVTRRAVNANIGNEQALKAWATRRANKALIA